MARDVGGAAACSCAERSAEAVRDARSAEAAVAEDFHPLRIRPYVSLSGHDAPPVSGAGAPPGAGTEAAVAAATAGAGVPLPPEAAVPPGAPVPPGALAAAPPPADVQLFWAAGAFDEEPADGPAAEPLVAVPAPDELHDDERVGGSPMRRRLALAGAVGSVVGVLAVGAVVSGVFSYEKPDRGSALPDDTRISVPDLVDPAPTSRNSSGSASAGPSPDRSSPPDSSPSPSKGASTSAASPSSRSAGGAAAAPASSATRATGTVSSTPEERGGGSQVLRQGDEGPEVVELQQRLKQLRLYTGEADGVYNPSVEDAVSRYQRSRGVRENGTYGPQTRRSLESETAEP